MLSQAVQLFIFLAIARCSYAQQCTSPALPTILQPLGGDTPNQADGVWYRYRQMGAATTTNPQMEITSVSSVVEATTNSPAWLQWWEITQYPSGTTCQQQFWTGAYTTSGDQIGDLGQSDDQYIMRPTDYVVLYHDYQSLMIVYGCQTGGANGLCATPVIFANTRKRPDQMSASDMDSIDATINSVFSKYCVSVQQIPKNTFTSSMPLCSFIDPPVCAADDIQGMKGVNIITPVTSTSTSYAPSACKWPNSMPLQTSIDINQNIGQLYVYRRLYLPETIPVNMVSYYTDLGLSTSPLLNDSARTYWIGYAMYSDLNATKCVQGNIATTIGKSGLFTGLIMNNNVDTAILPFTLVTLVQDGTSILYYGCGQQNLKAGVCDTPVVVHLIYQNPLSLSQAQKDALDALENKFFNQYGCSANDVPLILHTASKPQCQLSPANDCMQKHITGYQQVANQQAITTTTSSASIKY